jgi:hypothetical protein
MQSSIWLLFIFVAVAGAVGGVVNAFTTDNGFLMPKSESTSSGSTILRPGYLGNILVGAVAAVISWGLYGPLANMFVAGTSQALEVSSQGQAIGLSLSSLVGAVLIGIGGARWLSAEVDKSLLRAAGAEAAGKPASASAMRELAIGQPSRALEVAKGIAA